MTSFVKHCPEYELREVLFGLLYNHIAYAGAMVPVFESIDIGAATPYVVIGRADWTIDNTKSYNIDEYKIQIDIYTQFGGTLINCAVLDSVLQLLSTALNAGKLQFATGSRFCMANQYFERGSTEVIGNNNVFPMLLEQSSLIISCNIEQTA